jgi:predicted nucleic acid-binding protein
MKPKALVDSNFLYALHDKSDKYHAQAYQFSESSVSQYDLIIPDVVTVEVTHLLHEFIGYHAVIAFMKALTTSDAQVEPVTKADFIQAQGVMEKYITAQFDLVDVCIFILAERLNISHILTFDQRDFGIYRPMHCDYLELLP